VKNLKLVLLIFSILYLGSGFILFLMQERFIFLGEPLPKNFKFSFATPFKELNLTTSDGAVINALHFKADSAKGVIVYFHGNAGNLERWGGLMEYYVSLNYDVVIMDYRGFGKSTGKRSEKVLFSDAQLIYDSVKKEFDENKIIVFGRSIGTGIAAYIAGQNNPKMLVLETPYYEMATLVRQRFPIYPTTLALRYRFQTYKFLKTASCPIYIFHGTEDIVVP